MYHYIAQGIGFLGLGLAIISFQRNTHRGILLFQMIASIVFSVHFVMLGAYVGACMNAIGIFRAYIFYNKNKKWANNKLWIAFFILAYLVTGLITWDNIYSLLPMIAMILTTISFWINNPKYVRLVTLPGSPCWFIYNMVSGSVAGMLTEIFITTSIIVGMIRFDIKKENPVRVES